MLDQGNLREINRKFVWEHSIVSSVSSQNNIFTLAFTNYSKSETKDFCFFFKLSFTFQFFEKYLLDTFL